MTRRCWLPLALCLPPLFAADPALQSANTKMDKFSKDQWKPGELVVLSPAEVNAWLRDQGAKNVPQGLRDVKVDLGAGTASASALVDFVKIEQSKGRTPGFITKTLFEGERPLKISVRVAASAGKCTVYLTRVEVSGSGIEGTPLNLLLKTVFQPLYPDAKIGEPFDLDYNIERIELRPDGVHIAIKK